MVPILEPHVLHDPGLRIVNENDILEYWTTCCLANSGINNITGESIGQCVKESPSSAIFAFHVLGVPGTSIEIYGCDLDMDLVETELRML